MGTGGLNRLFAAMDNHVLAYNVQEGACVVLYNLAMAPENRAEIVDVCGARQRKHLQLSLARVGLDCKRNLSPGF